jgi:CYTH domain-containing protein
MYTDSMRRAFHSIEAPKGFSVEIIDNDHFLTIKLNEKKFARMIYEEKIRALQYTVQLKKALEMEGAVVLVTREAIK